MRRPGQLMVRVSACIVIRRAKPHRPHAVEVVVPSCTMTTSAVPTTSCRGCPSMAAGTILQEFHTLQAPYALTCSNCCRADTSGEVPHTAHSPRSLALARSYSSLATGLVEQPHEATEACSIHALRPFPRFPIGDKRAFCASTVSAPNRPKRDNCCSTWNPSEAA